MNKHFASLIVSILFTVPFAQQGPDTAIDFKSKDTKGVEHHLFSYLDSGKYVLIEFIESV